MAYKVSYNKPKKSCKIHKSECRSPKQVIGNRESDNQIYSNILDSCQDVKEYISNENYLEYSCCEKCKPNCCDD